MKQYINRNMAIISSIFILGTFLTGCSDNIAPTPNNSLSPTIGLSGTATVPTASRTATQPVPAMTNSPKASPTSPEIKPLIKKVTSNADKIGNYDKVELTVDLQASYTNPFDPAQIDLHANFVSPDGKKITVPGFYSQDYTSDLNGDSEVLTPGGDPTWKVRFTPTQTGHWNYNVEVVTPLGTNSSSNKVLEVSGSKNPGYLQVSPKDPAYFEFSTGQPFWAVGQNVGWYDKGGTHDYEKWFKQMSYNGANFARVWMASWSMGIEWSDGPLGDYSKRMDRAWQLDRVFDLAAQNNIYIMLSLLNHGAFSQTTNPEWDKNPYNAGLGGPCAAPQDFATNPQARELFKRRLRYIAARWGYSTHLLAWEWWNEVDFTPIANREILKPWIQEMTTALKSWEPFNHLKTTSYAHSLDDQIYKMPEINIVQRHEYSPADPITTFPRNMEDMRTFGKPALYAEYGGMGEDTTSLDKTGVHIHTAQWASLMTKGTATAMPWWWDTYIDPLNLYSLFSGPAAFVNGENLAAANYQPVQIETGSDKFMALMLKSTKKMLGWIKSNDFSYSAEKDQYQNFLLKQLKNNQKGTDFNPVFPDIADATISLTDLKPGNYKLEWWSTEGKGLLTTQTIQVKDTTVKLVVPSFQEDLAFKLVLQ